MTNLDVLKISEEKSHRQLRNRHRKLVLPAFWSADKVILGTTSSLKVSIIYLSIKSFITNNNNKALWLCSRHLQAVRLDLPTIGCQKVSFTVLWPLSQCTACFTLHRAQVRCYHRVLPTSTLYSYSFTNLRLMRSLMSRASSMNAASLELLEVIFSGKVGSIMSLLVPPLPLLLLQWICIMLCV